MSLCQPKHTTAFSLIEVLIATIILALGLLGLSALFAGSAVQQQRSTQITDSVVFAGNIESILQSRISGVSLKSVPRDELMKWDVLYSENNGKKYDQLGKTVSTGLEVQYKSNPIPNQRLKNATPSVVLPMDGARVPLNQFIDSLPVSIDPKDIKVTVFFDAGLILSTLTELDFAPAVTNHFAGAVNNTNILMNQYLNGVISDWPTEYYLYEVSSAYTVNNLGLPMTTAGVVDTTATYIHVQTTSNSIQLDFFQGGSPVAASYVANPAQILTIRNLTISYRATFNSLMSLNNRLLYTVDDKVPGGRRPVMGSTFLGRVSTNGKNFEIISMMYSLKPTSALRNSPDDLPFIPPDTQAELSADRGILREIAVDLDFDFTNERYFITALNSADEWLLSAGQWVVMSSDTGVKGGASPFPVFGADQPTRIVRVQTRADTTGLVQLRAYFDSGEDPRYLLRSPLKSFKDNTPIHVWVVVPTVKSLTPDNSEWVVEPREARLLTFPIEN